ncbi:hypothetical protein ACJMK2_042610 [Sinanodonta woodiana]|uniref:Uncharacterized protein n=1 Tax=Sinanodonta woodiana TaxID=1069815 RepID=A0ABD3WB16_SINWO
MSWEHKFSSVLRETDANLSRVKHKFHPASSGASRAYPSSMRKASSLLDLSQASTFGAGRYGYVYQNGLNQTTQGLLAYPLLPGATYNTHLPPTSLAQNYPFTADSNLPERIEQQGRTIDQLSAMVHRLEIDRNNYQQQVNDLRNDFLHLSDQASDKRPGSQLERRIENVKRELLCEIQLLQSQFQMQKAKGTSSHLSETQILSINKELLELKHAYRDELEQLRRDVEILRSRVVKIEMELSNFISNRRELERRQDQLDRTVQTISLSPSKFSPHMVGNASHLTSPRQYDRPETSDLRSMMMDLKGKMDFMESIMKRKKSTPLKTRINGHKPKLSSDQNGLGCLEEEFDLSDTDSSDFTDFKVKKGKSKKNPDLFTVNSDDDLELDDLKLSDDDDDDDDIDDDVVLSENSISDPLENEDV